MPEGPPSRYRSRLCPRKACHIYLSRNQLVGRWFPPSHRRIMCPAEGRARHRDGSEEKERPTRSARRRGERLGSGERRDGRRDGSRARCHCRRTAGAFETGLRWLKAIGYAGLFRYQDFAVLVVRVGVASLTSDAVKEALKAHPATSAVRARGIRDARS